MSVVVKWCNGRALCLDGSLAVCDWSTRCLPPVWFEFAASPLNEYKNHWGISTQRGPMMSEKIFLKT